ncbi:MAG: FGGY family carbohydrate kinase [Caldiserica bacterium]|jgi:xylulokinase|nr:FGGY family carbohydrate kinase [Caldisericota bacterium]
MRKRSIWAFDIGTSSVKSLEVLPGGKVLGEAHFPHNLRFLKEGFVEADPREWERSLKECAKALFQKSRSFPEALIIGGQGPTLVILDEKKVPLGNAISWMDRRAFKEADSLSKESGRFIDSSFYMPKALWVLSSPDFKNKVRFFLPCPEYLILRLTGKMFSGIPQAGFSEIIWDRNLMSRFGVPHDFWPEFVPCGTVVGVVTPEGSAEFEIPEGTPVILGLPDFIESWLGTGTIKPGIVCDRGGTSQGINLCIPKKVEIDGLITLPHFIEGFWNISGLISTTGKSLEKVKNLLGMESRPYEDIIKSTLDSPPGSKGLIFIPHLAGERSPFWRPFTRGAIFGLGLNHRPEDILRSVLEGCGFAIRQIIEIFERNSLAVNEVRSTGKQAQSKEWTQIKADITGKPFLLPEVRESEPLGGAVLGAVSLGWYSKIEEAVENMVKIEQVVKPNLRNFELYSQFFEIYKSLLEETQGFFGAINDLKNKFMEEESAYRKTNQNEFHL